MQPSTKTARHDGGVLRLPGRYYQMWPAMDPGGLTNKALDLPVSETGFVAFHCSNLGLSGGLQVDRWHIEGPVPQAVDSDGGTMMHPIIESRIVPSLSSAREAGITVFHVHPRTVGMKYPGFITSLDQSHVPAETAEAFPGWRKMRAEKVHGHGCLDWEGWPELDIAAQVVPSEGEYIIITGSQFDRILRDLGIVNLIYVGFYAYSSLLHAAAGIREMKFRYGYRPILLRECPVAEECPDTRGDRLPTNAAYRFIELQCGYTASFSDYLAAVDMLADCPCGIPSRREQVPAV